MNIPPDEAADTHAILARVVIEQTAEAILGARVLAHVGAIGRAGLMRWRDHWTSHDQALARIPGPLAEC